MVNKQLEKIGVYVDMMFNNSGMDLEELLLSQQKRYAEYIENSRKNTNSMADRRNQTATNKTDFNYELYTQQMNKDGKLII